MKNQPFCAKNAKMSGKGCFYDIIFLSCGHLNQNYDNVKTPHIDLYKENKELQENDDAHFGAILGLYYISSFS